MHMHERRKEERKKERKKGTSRKKYLLQLSKEKSAGPCLLVDHRVVIVLIEHVLGCIATPGQVIVTGDPDHGRSQCSETNQ